MSKTPRCVTMSNFLFIRCPRNVKWFVSLFFSLFLSLSCGKKMLQNVWNSFCRMLVFFILLSIPSFLTCHFADIWHKNSVYHYPCALQGTGYQWDSCAGYVTFVEGDTSKISTARVLPSTARRQVPWSQPQSSMKVQHLQLQRLCKWQVRGSECSSPINGLKCSERCVICSCL